MPLNQNIFSPLTHYSGSISAFTSRDRNVLQIISSSLPAYQNTGWDYVIMTTPSSSITTAQTAVPDLRLTLENNRKYIIEGYLAGANQASATGLRVGITPSAAVETYYSIQSPTSTTAIGYSFNANNNAASGPGNGITNYYFIYIKAIAITRPTGVATWSPTISTETAGTAVALGPSIIYYRRY
jgi:hypothetical protein